MCHILEHFHSCSNESVDEKKVTEALDMTESSLDPELILKTQETLGKFVKKPPLTEKLLKKPPFKFIHDVIKVVSTSRFAMEKHHRCFIDPTKNFVIFVF